MAIPLFSWVPSYSSRVENEASVQRIQFGENYSSRWTWGLNSVRLSLNLTFTKERDTDLKAISAFLWALRGARVFQFNPPSPFNIQDSPNHSIGPSYTSGMMVKSGSALYVCIQDTNSQPLTNKDYWELVCSLPLVFTCERWNMSPEQFDSTTLTATFTQEFDPVS